MNGGPPGRTTRATWLSVLFVALFAPCLVRAAEPAEAVTIGVRAGTDDRGMATDEWLSILRVLRPDRVAAAAEQKELTAEEKDWIALIRSRAGNWPTEIRALAAPYAPAVPPPEVGIVLGNRGGSDGFTPGPATIAFDVSALQSAYGAAVSPGNAERIDRLFRHEFTHLMQKSWLRLHPYETGSQLRSALLGIWLEGLGTWHSMSDSWRGENGMRSEKARVTLAVLEPRFCARLAALSCAPPEAAQRLISDLNEGAFDRKWGSLPVALWLDEETRVSPDAHRRLVTEGPAGVMDLAKRHLPPELSAMVDEIALQAERCAGDGQPSAR